MFADGGWSSWSFGSSPCSQSCGNGIAKRFRTCTNPPPMNGGRNCSGLNFKATLCNKQDCKKNKTITVNEIIQ